MPLFEQINEKHISPALNEILKENRLTIKKIESNKEDPNWENFVSPLQKSNEKLSRVWSQINHLNSVVNNEKLRCIYWESTLESNCRAPSDNFNQWKSGHRF